MFPFSLIQSKTRCKDPIQLLLKQMGRFLLMSLEIGSGPRGRSISQLDGSRAQLREKCSNGRAESMPQSQKMSGIRDRYCKPFQHLPSLHIQEIVTFQSEWHVSLMVVQISGQLFGDFVNPCSHTVQRGDHQLSTWCLHISLEIKLFNLALGTIQAIPGKIIPL